MENIDLDSVKSFVDTLWVIDCAILVFIMQAGFMCMETGLSRHKNSINVALKNAADFGVSVVIFWVFGERPVFKNENHMEFDAMDDFKK